MKVNNKESEEDLDKIAQNYIDSALDAYTESEKDLAKNAYKDGYEKGRMVRFAEIAEIVNYIYNRWIIKEHD